MGNGLVYAGGMACRCNSEEGRMLTKAVDKPRELNVHGGVGVPLATSLMRLNSTKATTQHVLE